MLNIQKYEYNDNFYEIAQKIIASNQDLTESALQLSKKINNLDSCMKICEQTVNKLSNDLSIVKKDYEIHYQNLEKMEEEINSNLPDGIEYCIDNEHISIKYNSSNNIVELYNKILDLIKNPDQDIDIDNIKLVQAITDIIMVPQIKLDNEKLSNTVTKLQARYDDAINIFDQSEFENQIESFQMSFWKNILESEIVKNGLDIMKQFVDNYIKYFNDDFLEYLQNNYDTVIALHENEKIFEYVIQELDYPATVKVYYNSYNENSLDITEEITIELNDIDSQSSLHQISEYFHDGKITTKVNSLIMNELHHKKEIYFINYFTNIDL